MRERTLLFGRSASLVGIVSEPAIPGAAGKLPAVILLNAGVVHRMGPNRLHVKIARRLAATGHVVLRFDFSGVGDSLERRDSLPLEKSAVLEIQEAMDCLAELRHARRFVLMAICSGAAFSVQAALVDRRVTGLVLINAAGHRWGTDAELSRTMLRHYRRMTSFGSSRTRRLRKLLTLDFDRGPLLTTLGRRLRSALSGGETTPPAAPGHVEAIRSLVDGGVRILMIYAEGDEGLDYYHLYLQEGLRPLEEADRLAVRVLSGANHTFTLLAHQRALLDVAGDWVRSVGPRQRTTPHELAAASGGDVPLDHTQKEQPYAR
jgi:hypothetical protein